ncbi:MAG: exo-alpha-sialidase, partial [Gimesia sp.]|nr:exo-alpha-sialidase [Gimesia sp.]
SPSGTLHAYRTNLDLGGIALVSGKRLAPGAWYYIDDLVVLGGSQIPGPGKIKPLPKPVTLWNGPPIPADLNQIPLVPGMAHQTIHRAQKDGFKFLHGAAIIEHKGTLYANWANSPTNENGPHETLQGRRSRDGGKTWSDLEVIGPGFEGPDRHSHGVFLKHKGELWTICSRFGVGKPAKRFPGLKGEAFVLNEDANRWESRGIVMQNCWPYDEPVRMQNGNLITGGQDKDGLPVVAISHGDDLTQWDTVLIPYPPELAPSFAETTVAAVGKTVVAIIRGGGNVAWVATSDDNGKTWSRARQSNLPMPRSKAYSGKLSTGQQYLISNLKNRDTLVISVSQPGETTLSRMWKIRHGKSGPPRFPGFAKGKQWSYPYAHEFDGKLYVVYSIGKEDCGLSILPLKSL